MYPKTERLLRYTLLIYLLDELMIELEIFLFRSSIQPFLLLGGIYFAVQADREEKRFKTVACIMGISIIVVLLKIAAHTDNAAEIMKMLDDILRVGTVGLVVFAAARPLEVCGEKGYAAHAHFVCAFIFIYGVFRFATYAVWRMPGQGILFSVISFMATYIDIINMFLYFPFLWKSRRLLKRAACC